jgi:hypothetical protein
MDLRMHQLGNIWQDRFGLMHAEYLSVNKIIPPFVTVCKAVCDSGDSGGNQWQNCEKPWECGVWMCVSWAE